MNLKEIKIVDDEDTAYDEVVRDIASIGDAFIDDPDALDLFRKKINQLMRLLNDEEVFE